MKAKLHELFAIVAICFLAADTGAQTETVTYELKDVSMSSSGINKITGSFTWTYTSGDFENGAGQFTSLHVPLTSETLATLAWTIETKSIEIVFPGSWHDKGVDITLKLEQPLTPTSGATVDLANSKWEIQEGVVYFGVFHGGTVKVACPEPAPYGVGSPGSGGVVPTLSPIGGATELGNSAFGVRCDGLLGGTQAFLLLGIVPAQAQALGVDILVAPAQASLFTFQASGPAGVAGVGTITAPLPIPSAPAFAGLAVYLQAIAIDSGSPAGLVSASAGLALEICL